jgi:CheY-like chemotaxis protein
LRAVSYAEPAVPIVFCSSYAANGVVRSAVQAVRNAGLIGKPFDESELAALLANAVKKASSASSS